jgi:eukaryotic-like serine/threonine-protein kinase
MNKFIPKLSLWIQRWSVALFLLLLVLCAPASCDDATMFRGNPQHTGVYGRSAVQRFNRIKWRFHTDGRVISSPAVSNGIVYVGSADGNLYAIDRESGTQKWKV